MKLFSHVPRREQRLKQEEERRERRTGHWSPWRQCTPESLKMLREGASAGGWPSEIHDGWTNGWCVVLIRTVAHGGIGADPVQHACITLASQTELAWPEKQKLKNEIFGRDRMAVEVMPRVADVIDEADSYHLWVFPDGWRFGFGLAEGQL